MRGVQVVALVLPFLTDCNGFSFRSRCASWHHAATGELSTAESTAQKERLHRNGVKESPSGHPLGPPLHLDGKTTSLSSSEKNYQYRNDAFGKKRAFAVTQISDVPDMYLLQNYVSTSERYSLMWSARNHPKESHQYGEDSNRNDSFVSWMQPGAASGVSRALAKSSADLFFSRDMKAGTGGAGLYEQLQLVRYDSRGEFGLHHDEQGRVLTVIYYLNGVAGTWFPLASGTTSSTTSSESQKEKHLPNPRSDKEAKEQIKTNELMPGRDGILVAGRGEYPLAEKSESVVRVNPGDALVFYNYDTTTTNYQGDTGVEVDRRAFHSALPASKEKFIATHWFHGGSLTES